MNIENAPTPDEKHRFEHTKTVFCALQNSMLVLLTRNAHPVNRFSDLNRGCFLVFGRM